MQRIVKIPSLLILLFGLALTMSAIIVEKATLEEIISESHVIVHGKVIDKISVWEGKQINTYLTLQVFDVAKGDGIGQTIKVKQYGGKIGPYADEISGQPTYEVGDEVFFFLVDWKGNYWIHSMAIGGYVVIETGGVKYAVNGFNDIEFVETLHEKIGEDLKGEYQLFDLFGKVQSLSRTE